MNTKIQSMIIIVSAIAVLAFIVYTLISFHKAANKAQAQYKPYYYQVEDIKDLDKGYLFYNEKK